MTTGRINQVTTFQRTIVATDEVAFSFRSSSLWSMVRLEPPYSPTSQISSTLHPVTDSNRAHGLQRELPTTGTGSQGRSQQSWRILKWLIANSFSLSASNPQPSPLQAPKVLDLREQVSLARPTPSQVSVT